MNGRDLETPAKWCSNFMVRSTNGRFWCRCDDGHAAAAGLVVQCWSVSTQNRAAATVKEDNSKKGSEW